MEVDNRKLWNNEFIKISIASFFVACASFLLVTVIPIYLSEELNVLHSKIGIILSSYSISLLLVRPFSGYLVDTFARKPLLLLGVTLYVISYFGYFYALSVIVFIAVRFFHGLTWGISSVSINTMAIDSIPSHRRAEGIGYYGLNMNLAMATAPYIAVVIYEAYSFQILILASIFMGVVSILILSTLKVPKRKTIRHKVPLSFDRFILVKGIPIVFNQILLAFGFGTLSAYAVLYGKHIDIQNAGVFFLFLSIGIVLSRVIAGRLVDKGYLHQVMVVSISLLTIGFAGFALYQNITFYIVSAFIMGLGYGILFPSLQTIFNNMADASKRGTANSTYLTGFDIGIGIGMLVGAFVEEKYGFKFMYLFSAMLSCIGLIIYWTHSRKVYEKHRII